ncbi:Zinc finger protein [Salix suchowensis]|nr:Zinc finger protein [Salix suchowensis]
MADVRALLKAKRQEARINHPLAAYSQSGQLRCTACSSVVKHASAWEGHLGSKAHRTNVARLKNEERLREGRKRQRALADQHLDQPKEAIGEKRKSVDLPIDTEGGASKKARTNSPSHPSQAPVLTHDGSDDEDENIEATPLVALPATQEKGLDDEWERFQREVVNAPTEEPDTREVYERATIMVDAEMTDVTGEEVADKETLRRNKEQDERELIMDRLLEEERAQEDADMKVVQMNSRLEALKKRREMRKHK